MSWSFLPVLWLGPGRSQRPSISGGNGASGGSAMRFDWAASVLAMIAALLTGAPALASSHGPDVIWVELCDAVHSGRRIPLPLRRDRDAPPTGCHAVCALMSERRARR